MTLLEFCQSPIQLNPWQLRIQCDCLSISRCCLRILLLAREDHAQACERISIAGIVTSNGDPSLLSFPDSALLFQRECIGGGRTTALRLDTRLYEQNDKHNRFDQRGSTVPHRTLLTRQAIRASHLFEVSDDQTHTGTEAIT